MVFVTDITQANKILQEYAGSSLQFTMYSISLRRVAILLRSDRHQEVVYIVGVGCEHINGYFDLPNSTISISHDECNRLIIKDLDNKFELVTNGGFTLIQGVFKEFGDSFESLIPVDAI